MKAEFMVERDGRKYVLYAGLLDLAHEKGLRGIHTNLIQVPSELNGMTAIVFAQVTMTGEGGQDATYSGLGDASPSNVTRMMAPHIIRMAETRAKARALRDAVNIGTAALEELGGDEEAPEAPKSAAPRRLGIVRPEHDSPAPDLGRLRETYRIRQGEAIALGLTAPELPADADANTIIDMGIALKDALTAKRAEIDAQRRGGGQ